jgi:hypothetical protein
VGARITYCPVELIASALIVVLLGLNAVAAVVPSLKVVPLSEDTNNLVPSDLKPITLSPVVLDLKKYGTREPLVEVKS